MMESEIMKSVLSCVKYTCLAIIAGGAAYVVYRRCKTTLVTLDEITEWANENQNSGTDLFVTKLTALPAEIRKEIHKEVGFRRILNGYKDEASVLATITDADQNIVKSFCFMGTKLDENLVLAMGESGLKIKLR